MSDQLQLNFNDQAMRTNRKTCPSPELTLPQNKDGAGYTKFQAEQAEYIRELEDRFGIILNRRVRVKLKDIDQEFEGKLVMAQLLAPDSRKDELRLRVGSIDFNYSEIEHVLLLEK